MLASCLCTRLGAEEKETYSCIVGLGNQLVIVLAFELKNRRALGIETRLGSWKGGQEGSQDCRNSGVMHDGGELWALTSRSRGREINKDG